MISCWTLDSSLILTERSPVDRRALMVWLSSEITIAIRRKHPAQVACLNQHATQQLAGPERSLTCSLVSLLFIIAAPGQLNRYALCVVKLYKPANAGDILVAHSASCGLANHDES